MPVREYRGPDDDHDHCRQRGEETHAAIVGNARAVELLSRL
jgi:hypothetical protein